MLERSVLLLSFYFVNKIFCKTKINLYLCDMINNNEQKEITSLVQQMLDTEKTYKSELVRYLGISAPTLYSRLEGKYEWRKGEIALIRELQKTLGM